MSDIIKQTFRYWQNIISSEETSLTYKALQANIDMDRKGHISYYTSNTKTKHKINPINKTEIKNEYMNLYKAYCSMYAKSCFQLLSQTNSNNESKGKFDVIPKQKDFIERRNM